MSNLNLVLALVLTLTVTPPPSTLTLNVSRLMGYGGGDRIQGWFRLSVPTPPADTQIVQFWVDDILIATDTEPPFQTDILTDNYPLGTRTLRAEIQLADGRTQATAPRTYIFVPESEGFEVAGRIVGFTFGALAVAAVVVGVVQAVAFRRRTPTPLGAPRTYGWAGGAICPACRRPFARHWWAPNLGLVKFDCCDHCGRWNLVGRASPEALAAAEQAERANAPTDTLHQESAEDRLRRQIEDSRWTE